LITGRWGDLAWGSGSGISADVGGGVIIGARSTALYGALINSDGTYYKVSTQATGKADFSFGASASAGIEGILFTSDIGQYSGLGSTLAITIGPASFTLTPGTEGGAFITFGSTANILGGFEISVQETHTTITPIDNHNDFFK
jgi:hypothetical protein